jgi:hypothetical protein
LNISRKLILVIVAGLLFQGSIYLYLDRVLLAPISTFQVSDAVEAHAATAGKAYYSHDRRYMAIVKSGLVEIYGMPGNTLVRSMELGKRQVSYFKWLEDRNLALMGLYDTDASGHNSVVLTQVNPLNDGHELSTPLGNLPRESKITEVAYSTATNVIYMQVQIASSPDVYRIYRTDANQDVRRVYFNNSNVGRIGILYDQDSLIYDNLDDGTVMVRHGDGSWKVISPASGKYRLIGVDVKNRIHIAKLNSEGLANAVLKVDVGGVLVQNRVLQTPVDSRQLKISE